MALPFDLDDVRAVPTMFFVKPEFYTIVAYIDGLNTATQNGLLVGLREWLVPKVSGGTNLVWSALMLRLAFPGVDEPEEELPQAGNHEKAIECMFAHLESFWAERASQNGLRDTYLRFQRWLERQEWYGPDSADWIDTTAKHTDSGDTNR